MSQSETHHKLIGWCIQNGGFLHNDVEVASDDRRGYHIRVKPDKTIPAMTRIASCPMNCALSVLNAIDDSPFSCHGSFFPRGFVRQQPTHTVQHFFLMEQYVLGTASWWHPYVSSLPTPTNVAASDFCDDDTMQWFEGTNLKSAFQKQSDKWRESFHTGMRQLTELKWRSAVEGAYDWNLYRWAATMFGSRSFTSQVLADTLPADRSRPIGRHYRGRQDPQVTALFADGFGVLLPCLDLLNYQPGSNVEWQASFSYVGLQVLDQFHGGQELCNNYGPRDNEALLLGYGFALQNNPFDHYAVALKILPTTPVAETRTWPQDPRSDPERRCYIFNAVHPCSLSASWVEFALFSFDLLDAISVLASIDRELQEMYTWRKTLMSSGLDHGFVDHRNILATVSQLLQECRARHRLILDTTPMSEPLTQKQVYAAIYRQTQLDILGTALSTCSYILLRARHSPQDDQVARTANNSNDSGILCRQPKLMQAIAAMPHIARELVNSHSFVTRPGELVLVSELLGMLRLELAEELLQTLNVLRAAILTVEKPSELDMTKACYALVMGAISTQAARDDCLPQRLNQWMVQIAQWYPPEDPNWSYVPDDTPVSPEEAPPPMLMVCLQALRLMSMPKQAIRTSHIGPKQWILPKRFCWGWNVMEEEGVMIPADIAEVADSESSEDLSFVIYCPCI